MEFEIRAGFLTFAEEIVHLGDEMRKRSNLDRRWAKKNRSYASNADVDFERKILAIVGRNFPGLPILSEEEHPKIPSTDTFASVDPLDGTAYFLAGYPQWAISICILLNGQPFAGLVVQPVRRLALAAIKSPSKSSRVQKYDYRDLRWHDLHRTQVPYPMFGTDFGPNSPPDYKEEVERYAKTAKRNSQNHPAVASGIDILMGNSEGFWSHTVYHWDMAAIAVMLGEIGGVIVCLDGGPVPWTKNVKLPPVVIADSPETARRIRLLIAKPEASHAKLASNST